MKTVLAPFWVLFDASWTLFGVHLGASVFRCFVGPVFFVFNAAPTSKVSISLRTSLTKSAIMACRKQLLFRSVFGVDFGLNVC